MRVIGGSSHHRQHVTLFVPQSVNWVQIGGFSSWQDAENTPTKPENPRARAIDQKGMLAGGNPGILPDMSVPRP